MILVDVNLLVYSWDRRAARHEVSRRWLDERLNGDRRVGLPWESVTGFMRVVTNPRIYSEPAAVGAAWAQAREWLACENVWIPVPGHDHEAILGDLLPHLGGGANLIPDAHLAALAIGHGLKLCSTDGDFARFPGLRWENPLDPGQSARK